MECRVVKACKAVAESECRAVRLAEAAAAELVRAGLTARQVELGAVRVAPVEAEVERADQGGLMEEVE